MYPLNKFTGIIGLVSAFTLAVTTARAVSPPPDGGYANYNTAEGDNALLSLTSGFSNTAIGRSALKSNTTGSSNTATGRNSLKSNTTGDGNTAIGRDALKSNTTGLNNTATGNGALSSNSTSTDSTATGANALHSNTTGSSNTATGSGALLSNTTGASNTADGYGALLNNTTGVSNTANGVLALTNNTTGQDNTAIGVGALSSNTTGSGNTADGFVVLSNNTTGNFNTANGYGALFINTTGTSNTAYGFFALSSNTSGNNNIAVGSQAGSAILKGNDNIDIGNFGVGFDESGIIRIGTAGTQTATFIAGISGVTVAGGVGVIVDTNGHLGTVTSSARYKDAIKPMDKASETILALKPVTFRYKQELDPDGIPQFGLVAEDVEKVNPDLVACDDQGKPYTVRYEAVNAMLLNEFLKEHRKVESLEKAMSDQQKENAAMRAMLKAQAVQIQKVSDQLRTLASATRVVAKD